MLHCSLTSASEYVTRLAMLSMNSCSIFHISLRISGQSGDTHLLVYLRVPLLLLASQMSRMAGSMEFKLFKSLGPWRSAVLRALGIIMAHLVAARRWLLGLLYSIFAGHALNGHIMFMQHQRGENSFRWRHKTVDSLIPLVKPKAARGPTKALLYKYTKEP